MKKKGFTLIELLAVIALLAVLIIVTLPNVIKYTNSSKEQAFLIDTNSAFDSIMSDLITGVFNNSLNNGLYCKTDFEQAKTLNITSDKDMNYKILVKNNKIVYFHIDNGEYSVFLKDFESGIVKTDITDITKNYIAVQDCIEPSVNDVYYSASNNYNEIADTIKTVITGYTCDQIMTVSATSEKYFSFDSKTKTITKYSIEGPKSVVIPCQIAGVNVKNIAKSAFENKELTSVIMPDTIISVGTNAFSNNKINKLFLGNSIENIGAGAFYNNEITELVLPNSLNTIESSTSSLNGAFEKNKLSSVIIGTGIKNIGSRAFIGEDNYNNIKYFNIPISNNLTSIGNSAFANNSISTLNLNTHDKLVIGKSAFINNKIIELNIISNTLNLDDEAFTNNFISNLNINSVVTNIGAHAFRNNQLPDANAFIMNKDKNGKNTNVLNSYAGENRNNITIPDYVNTIAADAFLGIGLTGALNTGNGITTISNNVFNSNMIEKVIIGDSTISVGVNSFSNNMITSLHIGKKLEKIFESAFYNNKINTLKFNDVLTTINAGAFYLNELTELVLPDSLVAINYSGGSVGGAFECNKLKKVVLGKNIDTIGSNAFAGGVGYNQITTLDITSSSKLRYIGRDSFSNNLITEVVLPKSLKEISTNCVSSTLGCGAFRNNRLTRVIINSENLQMGDSVFANNLIEDIEFNGKITKMGKHAFFNNQFPDSQAFVMNKNSDGSDTGVLNSYAGANRSNITIPSNVTSVASGAFTGLSLTGTLNTGDGLVSIDSKAFASNMLEKVIIGNGAKTIGSNAFYSNRISNLKLSNNLETIGAGAFYNNLITDVVFPNTLQSIESSGSGYLGAFENNKLTSVIFGSNIVSIGSRAFQGKKGYNQIAILDISKSNKLEKIGVDAFAANQITELTLPSSLKELSLECTNTNVACGAFRNNKIKKLTINSNSLSIGEYVFANNLIEEYILNGKIVKMGQNAFRNNKLPDSKAFIMNVDANGKSTTDLNSYAGSNRSNVTIPSYVKNIDSKVFNGLSLTGTLNTGNGLVVIGVSAFNTNSLKKVIIGDAAEVIERDAFASNKITEVIFGKNVKVINQGAFYNNAITSVTLNEGLERLEAGAFYVNKLTELVLPNSLKIINDPAPNVHGTFESNNLKKVTFGSGIEKIGQRAFSSDVGNNVINTIDFSKATNLKSIGDTAFYGNSLTEVIIPESVSNIGNNVFDSNNSLSKLFIRNKVDASNFNSLGENWHGICSNIIYELSTCYTYSGNIISGYSSVCGSDVIIPKKINGNTITEIAANAFSNSKLTSITIPSTIVSIGANAFSNNNLTSIVVLNKYSEKDFTSLDKNWNSDNINVIYEKNQSTCLRTEGTTVLGYYYDAANCNKDIVIPNNITKIADEAFNDHVYDSITVKDGTRISSFGKNWNGTIYKINFEGDSYEYNCFTLKDDKIISYKNICSTTVDLTSGKIQNVVIKSIADNAFKNMGVNVIILSDQITSIGASAFEGNDISSVYLREGLESIGNKAFYSTGLTSIALPASLKIIGKDAFSDNENLSKIILYGKKDLSSFSTLGNNWNGICSNIEFEN